MDHFKYYTDKKSKTPGPKYLDALVRLGDCYYATKQYEKALSAFDATIAQNAAAADYGYFRKGVIYGILGNLEKANQSFDMTLNKYPQSRHTPAALFQKAQFNFENGSYSYATDVYTKLINEYPESTFIPFALQSRAIAASNLEKYTVAEADYKRILQQYPTSEVANNALLGLQEVLNKTGKSSDFSQYVDAFRTSNPNSTQLENVEWVAAKSQYFNQQYSQAITSLNRFVSSYPSSSYVTEAAYLKADALYRTGDVAKALESYYTIAEDVSFNRHVRVIQRIAELELSQKNYPNAIVYFEKLEKISATKKDQATAWSGLMNAHFQSGDYAKAIEYGKITIEKGQITPAAKNEALLIIGKSYLTTGDNGQARDFLEQAAASAKDIYSAEAFYLIAKYLFDNNLYKESLDRLFQFSELYASYDYWLGKAFILMADNYIGLKEDFQAKATLESVIANSPVAEIVDEAKVKLMALNEKAKQQAVSGLDTLELENVGNE
ncbi:MAG: tetratricopeptide repeat protein [Cyclobacteriaceae bacterium]|nr:tetratricopeptide repeat protein [Cyclobacteriaceae bacterium]